MDVVDLNVSLVLAMDHEISDLLVRSPGVVGDIQRRVVTKRASRILEPEPGFRKQEAVKSGQTSVEQFELAARTSSRSLLPRTATSPAFTSGAKLGNAISEAPRSANIARAERDLTILGAADLLPRSLRLGSTGQQPEREQVPQEQLIFVSSPNSALVPTSDIGDVRRTKEPPEASYHSNRRPSMLTAPPVSE